MRNKKQVLTQRVKILETAVWNLFMKVKEMDDANKKLKIDK